MISVEGKPGHVAPTSPHPTKPRFGHLSGNPEPTLRGVPDIGHTEIKLTANRDLADILISGQTA